MKALRIVFDSNVFRPETFPLLEKSGFRTHCKQGRIVPIYGHIFLEETIRTYGIERKRQELIEQWIPFINSTARYICSDLYHIFDRELVQGKGVKTNIFMSERARRRIFSSLGDMPSDGSWNIWTLSTEDREEANNKKIRIREIMKSMRDEVSDKRKSFSSNQNKIPYFNDFVAENMEFVGRQYVPRLIDSKMLGAIADRWAKNKENYPYFTNYARNVLYLAYYAMTKPSSTKLDKNAPADLEIMLHLQNADALVSDEEGFLKTAFNDLWATRGKIFFNSHRFLEFLK